MTSPLSALYRSSLALATDLYQLTMAQAYWHAGVAEREAVFHLTFRREPFGGGYAIAAGAAWRSTTSPRRSSTMATSRTSRRCPAPAARRCSSRASSTTCAASASPAPSTSSPEGALVFAHEPRLMRVRAPILWAQLSSRRRSCRW